jgi:two-component system, OmpR family, response regulator
MVGGTDVVLILDRDTNFRETLRAELLKQDLPVVAAHTQDARAMIYRARPILISIEIYASADDDTSTISQVRAVSYAPLIAISANREDRVRMLDLGADDTMCKPLDLPEWLARVRALLRRCGLLGKTAAVPLQPPRTGGWALDRSRLKVIAPDGRDCDLTATEFLVFDALSRNSNHVMTREQIRDLVRGPRWNANDRLVDNQINRLRHKLAASAIVPPIKTVRGSGYMLDRGDTEHPSLAGGGDARCAYCPDTGPEPGKPHALPLPRDSCRNQTT